MTQTEALKLALDALEKERPYLGPMPTLTVKAITAIQEALAQPAVPQGHEQAESRSKFESWHKAEYLQSLDRYAHTYKNMHVRNRWQGWLAAHGIKEKNT
jgi:hypothetical protein